MAGLAPGATPHTLMEYFGDEFLIMIDESHITIPQIRGMYNGDQARKSTLVDYGFRLPSAKDNRPLRFDEFEGMIDQMLLFQLHLILMKRNMSYLELNKLSDQQVCWILKLV